MAYFSSSSQVGAPQLSGTVGALKTVLKTLLVDGFGAASVQSITVTGGQAVVAFASAHPYIVNGPIQIEGATPAALNGIKTVRAATAQTVTFAAPGVADTTATGASAKVPAAGWRELYAGTPNVLVLKPGAVGATGHVLRLDDTADISARAVGYEDMSDAATGVGPVPTAAQMAGGLYWWKAIAASGPAPYLLFADAQGFHLFIDHRNGGTYVSQWCGDLRPSKSGDAWAWLLTGNTAQSQPNSWPIPAACNAYGGRTARAGAYLSRDFSGVPGAVQAQRIGRGQNGTATDAYSGSANYSMAGAGPNASNVAIELCQVELHTSNGGLRGVIPGMYHARNNWLSAAPENGQVFPGAGPLAGRRLMALRCSPSYWGNPDTAKGVVFMDLTGPWER